MNHLGTKRIETSRLILRQLEISDATMMYNNWASSDEVTKYLTWNPHTSIEQTKSFIESWNKRYIDPMFYQWGIVLKENNQLIGTITGSNIYNDELEIGYCISKEYWHKGITTEALNALIDFYFNEVKVKKLIGRHLIDNPRSGKVLLRCGFTYVSKEKILQKGVETTILNYELINNNK